MLPLAARPWLPDEEGMMSFLLFIIYTRLLRERNRDSEQETVREKRGGGRLEYCCQKQHSRPRSLPHKCVEVSPGDPAGSKYVPDL